MSTTRQQLPLPVAERLAAKIAMAIGPDCVAQIEVAGSVRRRRPKVGDIELLAVPNPKADLFGRPLADTLLDDRLDQLVREGRLKPGRCNGRKQKAYEVGAWPGLTLELYLCDRDCWGVHLAIRTGPADFSRRLVTPVDRGGLLPAGMAIANGFKLFREGHFVPTPTEGMFFEALGLDWIDPVER